MLLHTLCSLLLSLSLRFLSHPPDVRRAIALMCVVEMVARGGAARVKKKKKTTRRVQELWVGGYTPFEVLKLFQESTMKAI